MTRPNVPRAILDVRIRECFRIGQVVRLGAELQPDALRDAEVFAQRHVETFLTWSPNDASACVTDRPLRRLREHAGIEPASFCPLGLRKIRITADIRIDSRAAVAGVDAVAGIEREARLDGRDALSFPAADDGIQNAVLDVPVPAASERKLIDRSEREAVRRAVQTDAAIEVAIIQRIAVAVLARVDQLRESECGEIAQSGRETALGLDLQRVIARRADPGLNRYAVRILRIAAQTARCGVLAQSARDRPESRSGCMRRSASGCLCCRRSRLRT